MTVRRGRPKKAEVIEDDPVDDVLEIEPEPESPPVMKVVERREYTRPMDETPLTVEPETAPGDFIDDTDAAFADFMSEADGQARMIRVYKLKDTFRPGAQPYRTAQGSFCDEIPLTTDWLKIIKYNWGAAGGYFRVVLMDPEYPGRYKKHKLIHFEPPSYSAPFSGLANATASGPPQYTFNYPQAPGAAPPDPLKLVREQWAVAREYASMMKEFMPPVVSTALAPVDPNQVPAVVELKAKMEMMEKFAGLSPDKQEPMLKVFKAFWGGGDDEGTGDRWLRILEGLTPLINMGMALLMQRLGGGAAPLPPGGAAPQAPMGALPPQPAAPQNPADVMLAQIVNLIGTGIQQGSSSTLTIAAIDELKEHFPDSQAAQQCELILTRAPQEVAAQLGLQHPDSVRWIGVLQVNWKQEEDEPLAPPEVLSFGGAEQ